MQCADKVGEIDEEERRVAVPTVKAKVGEWRLQKEIMAQMQVTSKGDEHTCRTLPKLERGTSNIARASFPLKSPASSAATTTAAAARADRNDAWAPESVV